MAPWTPGEGDGKTVFNNQGKASVRAESQGGPYGKRSSPFRAKGAGEKKNRPEQKCSTAGFLYWSGRWDSNPRPQPWQGCALPLSYARVGYNLRRVPRKTRRRETKNRPEPCALQPVFLLERAMGFEPTTPTLARLCSTPELRPHRVRLPQTPGPFTLSWRPVVAAWRGIYTSARMMQEIF